MKAYKGFDKNLKCRNFQYEIGKEYEEERAEICDTGFPACEYPLDVFNYYAPNDSKYCDVEIDGDIQKESGDTKVCGKQIRIGGEIGIKGIVEASIKFILEKIDNTKSENENRSASTNTGNFSASTVEKGGSIAIGIGVKNKAKACIGSAICLVGRGDWNGKYYPIKNIRAEIVDGEKLKADTFYMLIDGEFTEAEE